MPKKSDFEGEGNPTVGLVVPVAADTVVVSTRAATSITEEERTVLKAVLDRDRTSREAHGGLKSILSLSDREAEVLLKFLRRV